MNRELTSTELDHPDVNTIRWLTAKYNYADMALTVSGTAGRDATGNLTNKYSDFIFIRIGSQRSNTIMKKLREEINLWPQLKNLSLSTVRF